MSLLRSVSATVEAELLVVVSELEVVVESLVADATPQAARLSARTPVATAAVTFRVRVRNVPARRFFLVSMVLLLRCYGVEWGFVPRMTTTLGTRPVQELCRV
jgi:hypothetical protein